MMPATLALAVALAVSAPDSANTHLINGAKVIPIDNVQISAAVAAQLSELHVKEGDRVKAGQLLAQLENAATVVERDRVKIEIEKARVIAENEIDKLVYEKAHEVAKAELDRKVRARESFEGAVPITVIEQLELSVAKAAAELLKTAHEQKVARFDWQLKKNDLEARELDLKLRRIVSPIDGEVVQSYKQRSEWVDVGEPIVRILRTDRLRVDFSVKASQFGRELLGCKVRLDVRGPRGKLDSFDGKIVWVSPEIDAVRGLFRVWAEVENHDDLLRPGQQGELTIDLDSAPARTARSN